MTMTTYHAVQWCASTPNCPSTLNATISHIAHTAVRALPIDFADCGNKCLLQSMCRVSGNATMVAVRWGEGMLEGKGLRAGERAREDLRKAVWLVAGEDRCQGVDGGGVG